MMLIQGGGPTGAELGGRHAGARGRHMLGDRKRVASRRRRHRAERESPSNTLPFAEVTAGLAHELNNRLSVILGQAQLLRRGVGPDAGIARRLEKIEEETLRASRITRGLLDVARCREPRHDSVSINRLVPRALGRIQSKLRGRAIRVHTDLAADISVVRGDADQLTQVLVNLALNAIEAMGDVGTLRVTTSATDDLLEVSVTDTGAGMEPEQVSRIFEPFYTTKSEGAGTGLGLFHTLTVLKSHGGSIAVESEPGSGPTMRVRLPRPFAAASAPGLLDG